jgi:hypothetical protein
MVGLLFGPDIALIFTPTNNICSHGLTISAFVHLNPTIQKLKSHQLPTPCHLFSYIKREMKNKERKKKERRKETAEIKIEFRLSLLQMIITFDKKLRLRRAMRPHKA